MESCANALKVLQDKINPQTVSNNFVLIAFPVGSVGVRNVDAGGRMHKESRIAGGESGKIQVRYDVALKTILCHSVISMPRQSLKECGRTPPSVCSHRLQFLFQELVDLRRVSPAF